jgi:hypothetical protein
VLCRDDRIARRHQRPGHLAGLEVLLRPQDRGVELCDVDPCDAVPGRGCARRIRLGQRMAEPASGRIGVPLDGSVSLPVPMDVK